MTSAINNQQEGIVIQISGRIVKVKTSRHNDCANCGACPGNSAVVLDALNLAGAQVGQKVVVEVQEVNMLKAAFTVYVLPLIAVFIGALLGGAFAEMIGKTHLTLQIVGGLIAFVVSVWYVKHYDYRVRADEKMKPVIVRIV